VVRQLLVDDLQATCVAAKRHSCCRLCGFGSLTPSRPPG
jgi:hypothetical protein